MAKLPHDPKFGIGDIVYHPGTHQESFTLPCPDCHGTRSWQLISPAGHGYLIPCPRCSTAYSSLPKEYSLRGQRYVPSVVKLTIGSIQYDSNHTNSDSDWERDPFKYMCRETGIGSGSVYQERYLFPTQEEAQHRAEILAIESNVQMRKKQELLYPWASKLDLNSYDLAQAVDKLRTSQLRSVHYAVENLRETVCEKINQESEDIGTFDLGEMFEELKKWFFRINYPLEKYDETIKPYENTFGFYSTADLKWQD